MILCFDVGGTFVKYGLFTSDGNLHQKKKFPTQKESAEAFYRSIISIIEACEEHYQLESIGFSFPGAIDSKQGLTVLAGAIKPLNGHMFAAELQKQLKKVYPIYIENDGNCAALAEAHAGVGNVYDDFVVATLGTGIGGGIIQKRQLVTGRHFLAGEFGMMLIPGKASGEVDILAKYASTQGLLNLYREKIGLSIEASVSGEEIFLADTVEKRAVLKEWGHYVAMVLYNITTTINPEAILIGGGVSQNPSFLSYVTNALETFPIWSYFGTTIQICTHQENAGLIGAFCLTQLE